MLKVIFSEGEAQKVLAMVNEKVASIFLTEPKVVRFVFVDHIPDRTLGKVCLGLCIYEDNEVKIVLRPGWQNTAIHELAHLYSPDSSERKTEIVAKDIIKYLKGAILC